MVKIGQDFQTKDYTYWTDLQKRHMWLSPPLCIIRSPFDFMGRKNMKAYSLYSSSWMSQLMGVLMISVCESQEHSLCSSLASPQHHFALVVRLLCSLAPKHSTETFLFQLWFHGQLSSQVLQTQLFSWVGKISFSYTNPGAACRRTSPCPWTSLPLVVCKWVVAQALPTPGQSLPCNCKMKPKKGEKSLWSPNHTGCSLVHALLCAENLSL